MTPVTVDAGARNSYYNATNNGWGGPTTFAYRTTIQQLASDATLQFGDTASRTALAQSFTVGGSGIDVNSVRVALLKVNAPTDNVSLAIYSDTGASLPNASLATADNLYNGANVSTTSSWVEFNFATPVSLSASTKYWIVLQRSGSLDLTNSYRCSVSTASSYADGGRSVNVSGTWNAESSTIDLCFQILTKIPSALYQVTQDTSLHVWRSTDHGASWSEQDSGAAPAVNSATSPFSACDTRSGPYIGTVYFTGSNTLRGRAFNMSTNTWGSEWNAADITTGAATTRSIAVSIDNTFVSASHGSQIVGFVSSADDADIGHAYRATSGWTAAVNGIADFTSASRGQFIAQVCDKAPIGFVHRFYGDIVNGDTSMRSLIMPTPTSGSVIDLDTTGPTSDTVYMYGSYAIYQASGVDTIIAAFADQDQSIQERILTLQATSASVTMAANNNVGTATYPGRHIATARYNGTNYVFVVSAGTSIVYYDSTTAGTWNGPTTFLSSLTVASISTLLPMEGYGLLLSYVDNSDSKVEWVVAPSTGSETGTISSGSLSASGQAISAIVSVVGSLSTGSLSVSGQSISANPRVLGSIAVGSRAVTGQSIAATTGVFATITPQSLAVSGQSMLADPKVLASISSGSLAISGQSILGVETGGGGDTGFVSTGSLAVSGQAISALSGVLSNISSGSLSVSGQTILADPKVLAAISTGSHTVSGQNIDARTGVLAEIATGSRSITGQLISGLFPTVGTINTSSLLVGGQAIAARTGVLASIIAGSHVITGQSISGFVHVSGVIATGSRSVTGQSIAGRTGTNAIIVAGDHVILGQVIEGLYGATGSLSTGSYAISGQSILSTVAFTGIVIPSELLVDGELIEAIYGIIAEIITGELVVFGDPIIGDNGYFIEANLENIINVYGNSRIIRVRGYQEADLSANVSARSLIHRTSNRYNSHVASARQREIKVGNE
jgi:hypothetical protein